MPVVGDRACVVTVIVVLFVWVVVRVVVEVEML